MGAYTAREYLCSARDAAKLILDYDYKIMVEREKAYSGQRSQESRFGKGGVSNPMHHIDKAIDLEMARANEIKSAAEQVAECLGLLDSYAKCVSEYYARVLTARFIYCMTYKQIAQQFKITATKAERDVDTAIDVLDTEGIARVKSGAIHHTAAEPQE